MSNKIEFTANQTRSIVAAYKRGESSIVIAERFKVTSPTIIRVLRENKVKVKGRGRYEVAA